MRPLKEQGSNQVLALFTLNNGPVYNMCIFKYTKRTNYKNANSSVTQDKTSNREYFLRR